jgi:hypothetical protein
LNLQCGYQFRALKNYGFRENENPTSRINIDKNIEVVSGLQKEKAYELLNVFLERNPDFPGN